MRHHVAGLDHRVAPAGGVQVLHARDELPHLRADRFCFRRQVDAALPYDAPADQIVHLGRRFVAVQQSTQHGGAAEEQVGVVLPRHADTAVDLLVERGADEGSLSGERGRDGRGQCSLVTADRGGTRGIPRHGRCHLGRDRHVGAVVLHGLEGRDDATELLPDLGVVGRHLGGAARDADRLGAQDDPGQVAQRGPRAGEHRGGGSVQGDPRAPAGGVEVGW